MEGRQHVVANRLRRQPLERRGVGQCCQIKPGDRRDPVAADRQRGVNPDEAIDQAGAEESGREPGAPLDQEPGDAALAEHSERRGEVDLAGAVVIDIDQGHAVRQKRRAPIRVRRP